MKRRRQELEEPFGISPERMFQTLTTPTAIRGWFGASTAIIDAREGGSWITAFGEGERDFQNSHGGEAAVFEVRTKGVGRVVERSWS